MYSENEVAHMLQAAGDLLKEPQQGKQDKLPDGNPILERFPTCQLKKELRRRRKEGSWFRWLLWRMGL